MQGSLATRAPAVAAARQRPAATTRQPRVVVATAAGPRGPDLAVERRGLLLGAGALAVCGWLQQGRAAVAEEFSCEPRAAPNGVQWCDISAGFGEPAAAGDRIRAHYEGRLSDGKVFDSSYERGPFSFQVGVGQVIKGWDVGILGTEDGSIPPMKPGGRRRLIIPPELAYGSRSVGPIPPGSTLTFDVTFLGKQR